MKHILSTIILAIMAIGSFAQSDWRLTDKAYKLSYLIKTMPIDKMVGKTSEQGRDRMDSTYYLDTRIYEFPYETKKEQQGVKDLIAIILQAHDQDMPHYTGGFSSSNQLRLDNPIESKKLEMYYGENIATFVVGGKGRNYAVLRLNSKQNPYYRHVLGIEWWLERVNNKQKVVKFQTFRIFGPFSKEHYEYALRHSGISKDKVKEEALPLNSLDKDYNVQNINYLRVNKNGRIEEIAIGASPAKYMLSEMVVLASLYNKSTDETLRRATVKSINKRVTSLLTTGTEEEKTELFHILNNIPGYYVQIIPSNGGICTRSFAWYINALPKLDVLCVSWNLPGSPNCVYLDENNEEKPANFLLEVYLNSLDDVGILLEN